jgi:hypothetical protein
VKKVYFFINQQKEVNMFKKRLAIVAMSLSLALSAFAHASESTALTEAQYELSQSPSDLVVQSAHVNSFELTTAHSEAFQVENREVSKQERFINPVILLVDSQSDQLIVNNEVGWRRTYTL